MGKRIIQQRRGRGTSTYRVSKKAFKYKVGFLPVLEGQGKVVKLLNSSAHLAPLAKIKSSNGTFLIPASEKMYEGETISFENDKSDNKTKILKIGEIPVKTPVYCIESRPRDGGKFIKSAGNFAQVERIVGDKVIVKMPSKKEKKFEKGCRAITGAIAGKGRLDKPIMKAGKQFHIKKSKSKLWPRTSAVKMNAIDHPFGSGRGKNPKSKIAKRNSSPGRKVGLIRPKRTGKKK